MKVVRRIAAVLTGLVLLTAGYLKMLDPVGAGLQMYEYFKFFDLAVLEPVAKFTACFMAILEQVVGIALVTGVWRRVVAWISALMLGFFTVLTGVLWILNPDLDCGCFGELVKLTHQQSFIKNVILCGLWVLAFIPFRSMEKPHKVKYVGFGLAVALTALVSAFSLINIPAVDNTAYACGAKLYGSNLYNYDSPVLSFYNDEGEYCDSLLWTGEDIVLSIYDPDRLSDKDWTQICEFVQMLKQTSYASIALVASAPGYFTRDLGCRVYYSDPSTLVTLNRSNGGAVSFEDGEITGKCALYELPKKASDITEFIDMNVAGYVMVQGAMLAILACLLLL